MLNDISISALQAAMRGLSARQQAVSNDIANVNTPYFHGQRVEFESSLRAAMNNGQDPTQAQVNFQPTSDMENLNYNNVDLNAETMIGVDTQLRYDLALRATGDRFTLVRSAIRGS
jgi:flagellar basal-body rod protein FlgB